MQKKILDMFSDNSTKNFIRINIFDDFLNILHVKSGSVYNKLTIEHSKSSEMFAYLENNAKSSVEIVVGSRTMACKSAPSKGMSTTDVKSLAANILGNRNHAANTVFYEHKSIINSRKHIAICDAMLPPGTIKTIQKLFDIKNLIRCITVWPLWVVSTYFGELIDDTNKFSCFLFVIEHENSWEIIGYNSGGFVCYRQGENNSTDNKTEIESTIKYLYQFHKVSPDNIAIYVANEEDLDGFVACSNRYMSVMSDVIDEKTIPLTNNVRKIANFGMLSLLSFLAVSSFLKLYDNNEILEKIDSAHKMVDSVGKKIIEEVDLWANISVEDMRQLDYKGSLRNHIKESRNKMLQRAILEEKGDGQIAIESVFSE